MSQNSNLFLSVGKPVKDEYGCLIGKIASFAVTPCGKFESVFVELGNGRFSKYSTEHLQIDGVDITLVSNIKAQAAILCDQLPLIWRKDQALRELSDKKKISKEMYSELDTSFEGLLTQLKTETQALMEEIDDQTASCSDEIKGLTYALVNLEIEYEIGKIDNQGRKEMEKTLITGGAGFLGSHLCDFFMAQGHEVICIDNLIKKENIENIAHLMGQERFKFVKYDVTEYLHVEGRLDNILHFASLASPRDYLDYPIQTLKVGSLGTHKTLAMAKEKKARFLLASTSEVYGDPMVHPKPESYPGNVDPIAPRGVYDEAKRFAEAITMTYHRTASNTSRLVPSAGPRAKGIPQNFRSPWGKAGNSAPTCGCQPAASRPLFT